MLVPPGEAEPLARAIERLGGDLDLAARMGEAGRRRALERFLQERCTDRTELLYREKLQNGRARRNGAVSALAGHISRANGR